MDALRSRFICMHISVNARAYIHTYKHTTYVRTYIMRMYVCLYVWMYVVVCVCVLCVHENAHWRSISVWSLTELGAQILLTAMSRREPFELQQRMFHRGRLTVRLFVGLNAFGLCSLTYLHVYPLGVLVCRCNNAFELFPKNYFNMCLPGKANIFVSFSLSQKKKLSEY